MSVAVVHRITLEERGVERAGSNYKDVDSPFWVQTRCACEWSGEWVGAASFDWISHRAEGIELSDAARDEAEMTAVGHLRAEGWRRPMQTSGWTWGQIRAGMERLNRG